MKIIRMFNPQAVKNGAGEMLLRVLTFANGSYALHFVIKKDESRLDLYDNKGGLIRSHLCAESAYIFGNGNYILMFEPVNPPVKVGRVRFRSEFRLFNSNGQLLCDTISFFTPLSTDDMVLLCCNGEKGLYDANFRKMESKPADALVLLNESRMSAVWLPEPYQNVQHIHEFPNGSVSCVYEGNLLFFPKGATEPLVILPFDDNIRFLPNGCYWLVEDGIICDAGYRVILDNVDTVTLLDDVYLVCRAKKKEQLLFAYDGRQIVAGRQLRERANGVFVFEDANDKVNLVHRSGRVIWQGLDPFMVDCIERPV